MSANNGGDLFVVNQYGALIMHLKGTSNRVGNLLNPGKPHM